MISTLPDIGTSLACGPRPPSPPCTSAQPVTLADLLAIVNNGSFKHAAMLRTTASKFASFVCKQPEGIGITEMDGMRRGFACALRDGKYKPSSIKSYRNYVNMLLRIARDAGWTCCEDLLPPAWITVATQLKKAGARALVTHVAGRGLWPTNVEESDLTDWRKTSIASGMQPSYAEKCCALFRRAVLRSLDVGGVSQLNQGRSEYILRPLDMHPALSQEVKKVVMWKTAEFQPDRPASARIRQVSAGTLLTMFGRLAGYAQNVVGNAPYQSVRELITRKLLAQYAAWAINVRKIKGKPLGSSLGMVFAALRHNPDYDDLDLSWFDGLLKSFPHEERSQIDARKARKMIKYREADEIPKKIRFARTRIGRSNVNGRAQIVRDELLMLWLLILPWRQRNIRECRIGGQRPNVFKGSIPPFATITRPTWVSALERSSPDAEFWQIRFDADETKTKNEIHAFLPAELVPILEEYLAESREVLLKGRRDDGKLFLSNAGKGMQLSQLTSRVKNLALKHVGIGVTPHLYRDIVAFEWLSCHPKDYLTLSKILWHRNINTTLKIYGSQFNESTGVAMMDEWRTSRSV